MRRALGFLPFVLATSLARYPILRPFYRSRVAPPPDHAPTRERLAYSPEGMGESLDPMAEVHLLVDALLEVQRSRP